MLKPNEFSQKTVSSTVHWRVYNSKGCASGNVKKWQDMWTFMKRCKVQWN